MNIWEDENEDDLEAPIEVQQPDPPRKRNMGSDKDRLEMFREAGHKAFHDLYQHDPLIRKALGGQMSMFNHAPSKPDGKPLVSKDEYGNIVRLNKSLMSGAGATSKNHIELMREIKATVHKHYSIDE